MLGKAPRQGEQLVPIAPKKHDGKLAKTPRCLLGAQRKRSPETQLRTHRLCLPECVHNGTPLLSHHTVVPQPGFRVDGLPNGPQHLQRLPAVPAERRGLTGAQQAAEKSSCEPVALQSLQESPGLSNIFGVSTIQSLLSSLSQGKKGSPCGFVASCSKLPLGSAPSLLWAKLQHSGPLCLTPLCEP